MITTLGTLREQRARTLVRRMAVPLSSSLRLRAELEEGFGPHLLAERLQAWDWPDPLTLVLRPTLAFLNADLCLVAPGLILVMNALHWRGQIAQGLKGEWTGAGGRVDLGRPDRRAHLFCDRLAYSGLAKGFTLEPVVVFTGGPAKYLGEEPQATLVQWTELEAFLHSRIPKGVSALPESSLLRAITPS